MPRLARLSHLARPLDPAAASNRFALAASIVAGILGAVLADGSSWDRALAGGEVLVATFLSWALARELDPDRETSAGVAVVASGLAAALLGGVSVGSMYLLLAAARILARTTGLPPTPLDLAVNLAVAAVVARSPAGWMAGMALALAVVRDAALPRPAPRSQLAWGGTVALVVSVVAGVSDRVGVWRAPSLLEWAVVALGVVALPALLRPTAPASTDDRTDRPLDPHRLRWARGTVGAALVLTTLVAGGFGVAATTPAWLALAAVGVMTLASRNA